MQSAQWYPNGDYVLVTTVTGAWIYTSTLQDYAHLPEAKLAQLSPNGRFIAGVNAQDDLLIWDSATLALVKTIPLSTSPLSSLEWSPDNRFVVVSKSWGTGGYVLAVDLISENSFHHYGVPSSVQWSPNGQTIAFTAKRDGDDVGRLGCFGFGKVAAAGNHTGQTAGHGL